MAEEVVSSITVKLNAPSKSAISKVNEAADALDKIRSQSRGMTELGEVTKIIKETGSAASKSANFFSKMVTSLGRIAFYRAIRTALKTLTQAVKEGYTNLIGYSQAMNNMDTQHVFGTMTAYASAFLKIKNSVAAAVSPLVGALLPAIQTVANWFITGANAVNQFLSALIGKSTFTRATDYVAQIGEKASGSTGKVKELKRTLLGFDEINRLNGNSPSGGGGGGASTPDYASMFEEADIAKPFTDFADKLKEKVEPELENLKGNFDDLVTAADDLLTAIGDLLGIKWDDLIPEVVSYEIGYFSEMFGNIADGLNDFTQIVKAAKEGDVAGILSGILSVLVDIVELVWTPPAAIADFWLNLFGIDSNLLGGLHEVAETIKSFVDGGLEGAFDGIASAGETAGKNVREAWRVVLERLTTWGGLIKDRLMGAFGKIAPYVEDVSILIRGAWLLVLQKLTEWKNLLQDRWTKLWTTIKEKLSPVIVSIKTWFGGVWDKLSGIADNIKGAFESAWSWIKEKAEPVVNWLSGVWDAVSGAVETAAGAIQNAFRAAFNAVGTFAADAINGALGVIGNGINGIISGLNDYIDSINRVGNAVAVAIGRTWTNIPGFGKINMPTVEFTNPIPAYVKKSNTGNGSSKNNGKGGVYAYASGGFVSGDLFIAREAGPEMVGTIGSRTAVATNQDIVAAVSQGVASAVASVMGSGQQSVNVNVDGQNLFNILVNRNNGIVRQTGASPLLV